MTYPSIFARLFAFPLAIAALFAPSSAPAQIVLDGTMGTGGALTGPNYQIGANLGQTYGHNLFHSFSQFNLSQGQSANFSGPSSIQNILSRVTGGSPSSINGTLRSSIAGANFFFLNPSGVVFGPNAAVDVSGSFVVSTADVLKLQDGGSFHAKNPALSGLSSAPPAAFGFLNQNPAPIRINGSELTMAPGKNLTLVGGNIGATDAKITAPGGQIGMVSVGSTGDVQLNGTRPGLTQGFTGLGNISLNRTLLNVGQDGASTSAGDVAGSVKLRGRDLTLDNRSNVIAANTGDVSGGAIKIELAGTLQVKGNSHIFTETYGSGHGANVNIKAHDIILAGETFSGRSDFTGIETYSSSSATGNSGKISLNSETLSVRNGASLHSVTYGSGRSGDISINATRVVLDREGNSRFTGINTETRDLLGGANGTIRLNANALRIVNGARISGISRGFQNAGSVVIQADRIVIDGQNNPQLTGITSTSELNGGRGGHIQIKAPTLHLQNHAQIQVDDEGIIQIEAKNLEISNGSSLAANTKGDSAAGSIVLKADNIKIDGKNSRYNTGVFAYSESQTSDAGKITIKAKNLEVLSGASIITTALTNDAKGGDIVIAADRIVLDRQDRLNTTGIYAQTGGQGQGGSITLHAKELNVLGAEISVSTHGSGFQVAGRGGDINIRADKIVVQGLGGTISSVTTGIENGGAGGNIKIKTGSLDITDEGQILADTHGSGIGGSIKIKADSILVNGLGALEEDSITAISAGSDPSFENAPHGDGGRISIETGKLTIGNSGIIATGTTGSGNGGEVSIKANDVLIQGGHIASATVAETGGGNAGRINIQAESLKLEDSAAISANTIGTGQGGNISIKAQSIVLDGKDNPITTGIFAESIGAGDSGSIQVKGDSLQIQSGATISANTDNKGQGGSISIKAKDIILDGKNSGLPTGILAESAGAGDSGSIQIKADSIQLLNQALVDVTTVGGGKGGNIIVRADDALQIQSGAAISANTIGTAHGGDIAIQAKDVVLDGKGSDLFTGIFAESAGVGDSGSIKVKADSLQLQGGSEISASTGSRGQGGSISIQAKDVVLDGKDSDLTTGILAESGGVGNSGSIKIKADSIQLLNEALIDATTKDKGKGGSIILRVGDTLHVQSGAAISANTGGKGRGGDISIKAQSVVLDGKDSEFLTGIFAASAGSGDSGSIRIEADSLQLLNQSIVDVTTIAGGKGGNIILKIGGTISIENGSQVSANTFGSGDGGGITIKTGRLLLDGKTSDSFTGVLAGSTSTAHGDGGNIQVKAASIQLNRAEINVGTRGDGNGGSIALQVDDTLDLDNESGLVANTFGAGRGGDISVKAGYVTLSRGSTIQAASDLKPDAGDAGSIKVTARDSINLSGEAFVLAEAPASNGGTLSLKAGNFILVEDSHISTIAGKDGGGIQLNAGRMLYTSRSQVTAFAGGKGGNILINNLTPNARFVIFEKSLVSADAKRGNGGDILIRSNVFIRSAETRITASSELREDGNIAIDSPNTNVGGSLLQLPNNLLGAENYLSERCTIRRTGQKSSFTINTRRALPPLPGTFLPSNVVSK